MPRVTERPATVLVIVSLGMVLSSLDLFIANVALPAIATDLRPGDLGELSWVLNGYAIVFASLLVTAGRLADRTGRRRGFLAGVAIFTLASVACAASVNVPMLVACRVAQAVGAAMMVPTSLGLVLAAYPPERRAAAVRTWAVVGTAAVAISPFVAGPLVEVSWRLVFLINLPIGAITVILGRRFLPDVAGERGPRPDLLGSGLLTVAVAALTLGLVEGGSWGWTSPGVVGSLAAAVVVMAAFVRRSSRHPSPVVEFGLLRERGLALAATSMLISSAAFGGLLLSAVLWLENVWHWSPLAAGFGIAPGPLMVPLCSRLTGRLLPRVGPARIVVAGAALLAAGLAWWAVAAGLRSAYVTGLLGGMLLTGLAVGMIIPTLFAAASAALPPQRFATGSGIINMVRQIGITIGVAVTVAVLGDPGTDAARLAAFRHVWLTLAVIGAVTAVTGCLLPRPRAAVPAAAAVPVPAEAR